MRYKTKNIRFLCEYASLLTYDALSTGKYLRMLQRGFLPPSPVEVDFPNSKYWGSKLLQNAGNCLLRRIVSHHRKLKYSTTTV